MNPTATGPVAPRRCRYSASCSTSPTTSPLFADWVRSLEELYAGYTDEQLETILHFLIEVARRQRQATIDLNR